MRSVNKQTIFVSYRSPAFEDLVIHKCRVLNGRECTRKSSITCSYKECSFRRATLFASKHINYNFIIVPPVYILNPQDLLRVFDFISHCPQLYNNICASDFFMRFDIKEDSYWTEMEKVFWKMKCYNSQRNTFLNVKQNGEEYDVYEESFTPIDKNKYKLYSRLIYYIQPNNKFDHAWGKYSYCFVQRCPSCGKVFLLSLNAIKHLESKKEHLSCPYCNNGKFTYFYKKGIFPVKCEYKGPINKYAILSPGYIISLLLDSHKTAPKDGTPLICMSKENFRDEIAIFVYIDMLGSLLKKITGLGNIEMRIYNQNTRQTSHYNLIVL